MPPPRQYADSIERWRAHFAPSSFFYVSLDEMSRDPAAVLAALAARLDANPAISAPAQAVAAAVAGDLRDGAPRLNEGAPLPAHLEPDAALLRELAAYYRPHNERLFTLIGRDLGWHNDERYWWYKSE